MDKYYVDERVGCVAVRKRIDCNISTKLRDSPSVVWYREGHLGIHSNMWILSKEDVKLANETCDKLNSIYDDNCIKNSKDKLILDPFVKALLESYQNYIKLMGEELDDLMVMASIHGWESSRVKEGKTMRHILGVLEEDVLGEKVIGE